MPVNIVDETNADKRTLRLGLPVSMTNSREVDAVSPVRKAIIQTPSNLFANMFIDSLIIYGLKRSF